MCYEFFPPKLDDFIIFTLDKIYWDFQSYVALGILDSHRLRCALVGCSQPWKPNEGTNQRYLKNWANVADKICFGGA